MPSKIIYNCEVINAGYYVTSADLLGETGEQLTESQLRFEVNGHKIGIKSLLKVGRKIHIEFEETRALSLLNFDVKKFVNEFYYPQVNLKVCNQNTVQYEVIFKDDDYLADFDTNIFQRDTGRISYYQYQTGSKDEARPLVVFLHGSGERGFKNQMPLLGNDVPKTIHDYISEHENAVLLVPQATWAPELNGWFRPEIRKTLLSLIKSKIQSDNIDSKRIYLVGLSNGGAATWHFAEHHSDLFSAIVPCCGYIYNEDKSFVGAAGEGRYMHPRMAEAKALKETPIWAFHSHDDHTVNVQGTLEATEMVKKCGNQNVNVTIYDDGKVTLNPHGCWEPAFDTPTLLPWLFSQRKA
ncbi:prolyl oligopeptidase family serine peptidase [Lactiplantibacillus pentosus]|uniref:carboxylesterase family protein n=1 Tax=Lactiplantibacillus pentosus TaxID=1589 RepID=UPI001C1EFA47|nr:PHB depolymerase family esterase [Lactiplantibacillus pentosus]MBU7478320.1 prolyl oligopeptidase family serine peptidase [Lactiplantibacillus pentosus]MBU7536174.1 prolyl oligopeptidase family serine peptidase [Lactiplantibacillus pentosus]MDT7034490.1 prolyl oligopeptidase family serine peptidase [Lactiplantibacillus pentosus]